MDPILNPFSPGAGTPPPALVGRQDLLDKAKVPFATLSLKDAIQYAKKYFEGNAVLLKEQFDRWS